MGKLGFLAGAGVGYVLGARDGRERYEQLKSKALDLWGDASARDQVNAAGATAREPAEGPSSRTAARKKAAKTASSKTAASKK